ncbi:DUF935 family protein [Trichormus variabilis]|uniref:Uncharacterized protein n=1 Tax=Trichormus variabilis SAG 1403-4b TaxID=447716 RepID=A0A3S1I5M6_ANAVA|nr:DUF935 family protein [Trichormus variabilis]RUS92520.1 hypothetical protein DSM107003_50030 [Trichormus variabilis SAG 1403-4b]
MPIQLPTNGTLEQKRAVFKFLAQSQYQGNVDEVLRGPVRTSGGGIAGRFKDGDTVVYCQLQPQGEGWQAHYEVVFAENLDTVDSFTEQLRGDAGNLTDGWIEQIRGLLDKSEGLVDFQESLLDLYPDLPIEELSSIMGEAMTTAHLAGQYEAEENG